MAVASQFTLVGTGLTVFEADAPVEGRVVWLDSPKAVLDFVAGGDTADAIVLARGGTTTFLTPALSCGVRGVMTLQGSPESHLGILSREYGIPCLMSVAFTEGVRSDRGEVIPPDGARVRLDATTSPEGRVFVEAGAARSDEPAAEEDPEAAAAAAAQAAQLAALMGAFRGEVPGGVDGDRQMRRRLTTSIVDTDDASIRRALTPTEVDDFLSYSGWNLWDLIAARQTEGESGLIPRQEYETVSFVQQWATYGDWYRRMVEELGVDGIVELGRAPREEIGAKVNHVHIWTGMCPLVGRGITTTMGLEAPGARPQDVETIIQFTRALQHGLWGGGPGYVSGRGYRAPVLADHWLERFRDEEHRLDDPDELAAFRRFNATTELCGFLLHYDCRAGLCDTGPYPLPDGGFVIVRDHFLHDPTYEWASVVSDLPHCVTQAMFFRPDGPQEIAINDIATTFAKPANYLKHLSGAVVYARDRWDTPMSDVRRLDPGEMDRIVERCNAAMLDLYATIGDLSVDERIRNGVKVYTRDMIAPYARRAGLWEEFVADGFDDFAPLTEQAYPALTSGGAQEVLGAVFLTGQGVVPESGLPADPEAPAPDPSGFQHVGTGRAVFTDPQPVEGPVVWLDSPQAVIAFVAGGGVQDSIVLARGGTTTFLTPALTAGVKGVMTLQGAPESHLGILSREYGIPCIMGVQFEDGVRSDRGEVIPADGAIVRLDISAPEGRVSIEPGAPSAGARGEPTAEEQALAAQMEQVAVLLANFRGDPEVPHGAAGDATMRARQRTDVLELTDASLHRDLTVDEVNDLMDYMGFNLWDILAARSTEGESGLIPRQEYEAFGCVQQWQRAVGFYRLIAEKLGPEGVIALGATARNEVGNKLNQLHIWCTAIPSLFGRGVLLNLGMAEAQERSEDVAFVCQFMRRLYRGFWGDEGPILATSRGNRAPILSEEWVTRLSTEATPFTSDAQRSLFQRFNATTEITGFLLHFDNRAGLSDTGPYPLPDGGFMIVRDHFLHDPAYHWHDVAEELPHCLTQAMIFHPDEPLDVSVLDIGTLFSEPSNYLRHLTGMAVYVRERWDTPVAEIRRLDEAEMEQILLTCDEVTTTLYKRIAAMPPRERIMCGAQVYYADFVAPFARAAGLWDEFVAQHDFYEIDPIAATAYYPLVRDKVAASLVPEQFLTATAYQHIARIGDGPIAEDHAEAFEALHLLKLRGLVADLPGGTDALEAAGLVVASASGAMLTEDGHRVHGELLDGHRAAIDAERLAQIYERFLPVNVELKGACARWHGAGDDDRAVLLEEIGGLVVRAEPALRRSAELVERFGGYTPRLQEALRRAHGGEHDYVTSPAVESVHTVWMELHEDYVQLLGVDREAEGSY